jgi:hypothetical protein
MPGDWIHPFSSTVRIGGHDPAGNKARVASNKCISRPRRRRANVQRPHRRRPCLRPAGPQQIPSSNEGLAQPRSRPKRIQRRRPRTCLNHPDRVMGQAGTKIEGPFIVKSKASPSAYRLTTPSDEDLDHSWNIDNLRKFFV